MFDYVMVLASIIIGLGLTHILQGLVAIVQSGDSKQVYWVHLLWVAFTFLNTALWWWWEYRFRAVSTWTVQLYFFVLFYAFLTYLLCAFLLPRKLHPHESIKAYFYARRAWFFGLLIVYFAVDFMDTWLKGIQHVLSLGPEYLINVAAFIVLSAVAIWTRNERFHAAYAIIALLYLATYAVRAFDIVG